MLQNKTKKFYLSIIIIILFLLIAILCLYFSYYSVPIGSDNGNVLYESKIYLEDGFDRGYSTLQPIITTVLNAIFFTFSNNFPFILISGIFSILLTLIVFKIVKNELGLTVALISLVILLLSPLFFERSWYLAPYPMCLFLISSSIFLYIKAEDNKSKNTILTIISAFLMVMAIYAWTLALTMLAIPLLYHLVNRSLRLNIHILTIFYISIIIMMMPWLIWHLQIGGIQHFYFGNYSWYSVKYLPIVNRYFWDYGSPGYSNLSQLFDYYSNFFSLFWGQLLIGVSWLFILIGLIKIKSRLRALCIVWIIITIVPLLLIQTATFARYIYFTLPPFIILASYGFYYLIKRLNKKFILAITLLVLILGCLQIQSYFENFLNSSSYPSEDSPSIQDINLFKTIINDNNNIYSRHHAFQYYFQNNRFIVPSDMSEEDSISFLSWKNEADISIIMEKYQIGWIMLYKDESWEKDYYIWVKEVTGDYTKHYINIEDSANFQKVSEGNIYILYKYIEI